MKYIVSATPQSRAPEQTLLPQGYQSASQAVPQHGLHTGSTQGSHSHRPKAGTWGEHVVGLGRGTGRRARSGEGVKGICPGVRGFVPLVRGNVPVKLGELSLQLGGFAHLG